MGKAREKDRLKREKWFGKNPVSKPTTKAIVHDKLTDDDKQQWISFIPAAFLDRIPSHWGVISIRDKYGNPRVNLERFENAMVITVDASGVSEQYNPAKLTHASVRAVVKFICAHHDKPIVVHCNEGACRSPAIAEALGYCLGNLLVDTRFEGCNRSYYGDTKLTREFIRLYRDIAEEPEMATLIKDYNEK